ncbi:MAG TPA: hypothetical protein VIU61_25495 [Kofleriaceae bacterium]
MTRLLSISTLMLFLSGCLVSSRPRHHQHRSHSEPRGHSKRDCPPSYHMSGGVCVHNGNKGRGRR